MSWFYMEQDTDRWETPEVRELGRSTHTARVSHECGACRGTIQPGQRYTRAALVVDGEFSVEKFHVQPTDCLESREEQQAWMDAQEAAAWGRAC